MKRNKIDRKKLTFFFFLLLVLNNVFQFKDGILQYVIKAMQFISYEYVTKNNTLGLISENYLLKEC